MAAVEHAMRSTEQTPLGDRDQSQISPSVRFTPVNGTSLRQQISSFRPQQITPYSEVQNSPQKNIAAVDLTSEACSPTKDLVKANETVDEKLAWPDTFPRSPTQPHGQLKRKRSVHSAEPISPLHTLIKQSSPSVEASPASKQHVKSVDFAPDTTAGLEGQSNNRSHGLPQISSPNAGRGSDKHLSEALQDHVAGEESKPRSDDNDGSHDQRSASARHSEAAQSEGSSVCESTPNNRDRVIPGKRKFSQRTKSGCHTCRSRKKKCDETKPKCNNCIRGNFECQGYGPRTSAPTKSYKPQPLQSRAAPSQILPAQPPPPVEAQSGSYLSTQGGNLPFLERMRFPLYEADPTYSVSAFSRHQGSSDAVHMSQYPHQLPPASGYGRAIQPNYHASLARLEESYLPPNMPGTTSSGGPSEQDNLSRMTEKEKMLTGRPYRHYIDEQLIQERNECRERLEKYNKACLPSALESMEEIGRKLRAVLEPRNRAHTDPVGTCGSRVIVESPFSCEYGYNINIGDDVVIQAGCTMLDPCKISIGNRTIIGPGVRFFGKTAPMDPKLRNGSQGVVYGGSITIEEDCYIGGNVTILPNRTIRKGSVVGADTIVSKDVQASTVVAGNPMRVLRDLGPAPSDAHKRHIQQENDASVERMRAERDAYCATKRVGMP